MSKKVLFIFTVMVMLVLGSSAVYARHYQKPDGYVNDFAVLLTDEQRAALEEKLAAFVEQTTIVIVVVTVDSLDDESIDKYTQGLAFEWKVGMQQGGQSKGVVFLVAPNERVMWIQVTSGTRLILTDMRADEIRDDTIMPLFQSGSVAQGIIDGTNAIMRVFEENLLPAVADESALFPVGQLNTFDPVINDFAANRHLLNLFRGLAVLAAVACLVWFFVVCPIRRFRARRYVLGNTKSVSLKLTEGEEVSKNLDVGKKNRDDLTKLRDEFSGIWQLIRIDKDIDWIRTRKKLKSVYRPGNNCRLAKITESMEQEIVFANKAREKARY